MARRAGVEKTCCRVPDVPAVTTLLVLSVAIPILQNDDNVTLALAVLSSSP